MVQWLAAAVVIALSCLAAALDALMRQPGPKAPWSTAPVPAIAPVMLGPFTLTNPLAQTGSARAPATS
jgi:hypothetical protein